MKDITHKPEAQRTAVASGKLHAPEAALQLLRDRATEKGDALEAGKIAGIMAAKNTPQIIPYCHPVALRDASIRYEFQEGAVRIEASCTVIAATGVEMEALAAVSAAALTLYDMLKPHVSQNKMSISDIHLLRKRGGKSQYLKLPQPAPQVLLMPTGASDADVANSAVAATAVAEVLLELGCRVEQQAGVSGDAAAIGAAVQARLGDAELLITTGGTGYGANDHTVAAVEPLLSRPLPGLMEAARAHGQRRTPFAMLSAGVAGLAGDTLLLAFPGSRNGATESLHALLPGLLRIISLRRQEA